MTETLHERVKWIDPTWVLIGWTASAFGFATYNLLSRASDWQLGTSIQIAFGVAGLLLLVRILCK